MLGPVSSCRSRPTGDGRLHKVWCLAGFLSWVNPSMRKGVLDMTWNNTKFIDCFWARLGIFRFRNKELGNMSS